MAVKIALAGNPNCGKTTLFNALTGSNQFVGNWPGVTVEKKEGRLKGHKDVTIMDLPGIYSLSPYTLEEVVARNYLVADRPDAIINIVDGTNIERNLYLSTQIMELGIPVIMAVNMMDIVAKNGDVIHIDKLSQKLGCEVVEISALKGTGITKAAEKAVALAQQKKKVTPAHAFSSEVEDIIAKVEDKISSDIPQEQKRFFAIKLLEKDDKISELLSLMPDVSAEIKELEDHLMMIPSQSLPMSVMYTFLPSLESVLQKQRRVRNFPLRIRLTVLLRTVFLHFRFLHWLCLSYIMYLSQQLVDSLPIGQMIHCLASGLFREQEPYLRIFTVPAG